MRDSTFTLQALHYLNLDWQADEFIQFVADVEPNRTAVCRSCTASTAGAISPSRPETSCRGMRAPARCGSATVPSTNAKTTSSARYSTRILLHTSRGKHLPRRLWPLVQAQAECAIAAWREPDQGIWEARGKPQHYVSSKLMGWVAMDRAAKLAAIRHDRFASRNG